ncbi:uncharacterized protein BDZ99DRAFT_521442 [Mytilinidion resinicola]|uniref:Uncharacterized protein n=1 Tax=Mytilinidion resinicola TaxID=574789 RepID=A0A6A6YJI6_9PEZI|nr:uncharacterized protein BDZ99DRAFT_521442 [Mytilinidion resinicola]KAF2808971.1 hypothetical protein BDZ99DRAFT_521442 [Mytilinidion resinicola]
MTEPPRIIQCVYDHSLIGRDAALTSDGRNGVESDQSSRPQNGDHAGISAPDAGSPVRRAGQPAVTKPERSQARLTTIYNPAEENEAGAGRAGGEDSNVALRKRQCSPGREGDNPNDRPKKVVVRERGSKKDDTDANMQEASVARTIPEPIVRGLGKPSLHDKTHGGARPETGSLGPQASIVAPQPPIVAPQPHIQPQGDTLSLWPAYLHLLWYNRKYGTHPFIAEHEGQLDHDDRGWREAIQYNEEELVREAFDEAQELGSGSYR